MTRTSAMEKIIKQRDQDKKAEELLESAKKEQVKKVAAKALADKQAADKKAAAKVKKAKAKAEKAKVVSEDFSLFKNKDNG
jgi:hypothetical protein